MRLQGSATNLNVGGQCIGRWGVNMHSKNTEIWFEICIYRFYRFEHLEWPQTELVTILDGFKY